MIEISHCLRKNFMGMRKIGTETETVMDIGIEIERSVTPISIFVIFLIEMQSHLSLF